MTTETWTNHWSSDKPIAAINAISFHLSLWNIERPLIGCLVWVSPAQAKPGSHLVWEWNGRTYQVEVIDGGYVMDGKVWRSLSAIARHITGARWSGPRFFGVQ